MPFSEESRACCNLIFALSLNSNPKSGSSKTSETVCIINGLSSLTDMYSFVCGIAVVCICHYHTATKLFDQFTQLAPAKGGQSPVAE